MDDEDLLRNAAKAIGIHPEYDEYGSARSWDPLKDDGDAMRLAVTLRISVHFFDGKTIAESGFDWDIGEPHNDDAGSATRRAIVRSAADIGRGRQ